MTITFEVAGRLATVETTEKVVAGNTYQVALDLDGEWTGTLFMRVRFGSLYYDIPFQSTASTIPVQMPVGYPEVGVGIFSEALEICTNEARIRLLRSILEEGVAIVEFDDDLYNQWTEEITELLCDDHFDASSNRPVQNRVITAWKDIVPLDADLVHKTGEETIAGVKTFTSDPVLTKQDPGIELRSSSSSATTGWRGHITVKDDGGATNFAQIVFAPSASGYTVIQTGLWRPDRSARYYLEYRAYPDHPLLRGTSYLPTDSSGNPVAVESSGYMTSGMVAVDPRLVHTTGNEDIAGVKNFLAPPTCCRANVVLEIGQWCKMLTVKNRSSGNRALLRTAHIYKTRSLDDKVAWLTQTSSTIMMVRSQDLVFKAGLRSDGYWDLWVNAPTARGPIYIDVLLTQGNVPVVDVGTPQADPPAVGETYTKITDGGVWE